MQLQMVAPSASGSGQMGLGRLARGVGSVEYGVGLSVGSTGVSGFSLACVR